MKRCFSTLILLAVVGAGLGCQCCGKLFPGCGTGCGAGCPGCGTGDDGGAVGPASAAVTYPYYTNRGPRDFLAAEPRGIGP
jgi:hypothetical protein